MEKDIKILEELHHGEEVGLREIKALENLIKGYREVEEIIIKQEKCIKELESTYRTCAKEYVVEKSKIKEKIKELEDIKLCFGKNTQVIIEDKIKLLQELMEDK